jgi:tRNA-Thr(GGU) m(6)t(6)A37 methyltransferase TsaA
VLFWFDRAERPTSSPELRPAEGREELPPVGLFAIRTPRRPNPIGMSVVRLHRREANRLHVTGLDAWNGTPVLDLKGYNRRDELRPEATHPAWLEQLWAMHDAER